MTAGPPRRVMLVAGEASGDRHAAGLVREARSIDPALEFEGVGGAELRRAGVTILHDAREVSVVGISEVVGRLPAIFRILRALKGRLRERPPTALLLVDFPDFNLRLAEEAARLEIPVVYYISPQVWAWRSGRVETIRRLVRKMIVLFPFEERYYRDRGVPAVCVGHPLAELGGRSEPAADARARLGLDPARPVFGLLPGSRDGEVRRHLAPMLDTARLVAAELPEASFVTPVADTVEQGLVDEALSGAAAAVVPVRGDFDTAVAACDAAVVASGTATLEVALRGVPPVVVYRLSALTHLVGRLTVKVPHVSLVNLIAGRRLVPELIQRDFTPRRAASELLRLGRPGSEREAALAGLAEVRERLGRPGSYARAARELVDALDAAPAERGESAP